MKGCKSIVRKIAKKGRKQEDAKRKISKADARVFASPADSNCNVSVRFACRNHHSGVCGSDNERRNEN